MKAKFVVVFLVLLISASLNAKNLTTYSDYRVSDIPDSMKMLAEFSLFNEYYKNKDYQSAYNHGWNILNNDPTPFLRWRPFNKMDDILWYLHDSVAVTDDEKKALTDTTLYFYDLAAKYEQDKAGSYMAKKAYIMEIWKETPVEELISVYEKAFELDPKIPSFYQDRLGNLYAKNATEENGYKLKALDLYSKLSEEDPSNPTWISRIEGLAENIDELVTITGKAWKLDAENPEKAWKYASTALRAKDYNTALEPLLFLVEKTPDVVNYWVQLSTAYQKLEMEDKALDAYKKLIEIDSQNRDHYVNVAIIYKNKEQLSTSRNYLRKASEISPDWDYPVFIEATLYEQAARNCGFEFMDKCVYLLAQQTYARAKNLGGSFASQAQERMSALSSSIPTKEELFFRNIK